MKHWNSYFALLMDLEGTVFENDPNDPGGATKFGIDQRSHPGVNIRALTIDDAERIYLKEFSESAASWMPEPFAEAYFDFVINSGEGAAAKALQRALGMGVIDGIVGPKTKAEFERQSKDIPAILARFTAFRAAFYERLAQSTKRAKYRSGWLRRNARINEWAVKLLK